MLAEAEPVSRQVPAPDSDLHVLFAGEDEIRALNREFLGVDGPHGRSQLR